MEEIKVKKFGENGKDKWYSTDGVNRIPCGETEIDLLWRQWIMHKGAERADDEQYTIFDLTDGDLYLFR